VLEVTGEIVRAVLPPLVSLIGTLGPLLAHRGRFPGDQPG
jgi:hypothetical protein